MRKTLMPFAIIVICFGLLAGATYFVNSGSIDKVTAFVSDAADNVVKHTQERIAQSSTATLNEAEQTLAFANEAHINGEELSNDEINKIGKEFCDDIKAHVENISSITNVDALVYNTLKNSAEIESVNLAKGFLKEGQQCDESFFHLKRLHSNAALNTIAKVETCVEDTAKLKSIVFAENMKKHKVEDIVKKMNVTATAYTNDIRCIGAKWFDGKTATMTKVRWGVVAVDPRVIPLGSKIYIENMGWFSAEDTGGKVKGNKIDIFYPTRNQAIKFGKRKLKVFVLPKHIMKKYNYKIEI